MIRTRSRHPLDMPATSPLAFTRLLGRLFGARRGTPTLDPDALSDALRRDLGFIDGRHAVTRDPRWD